MSAAVPNRLRDASVAFAGTLALAGSAGAAWLLAPVRAEATSEAAVVTSASAALMDATTGVSSARVQAVGADAQLVNAALPFDRAPVRAAAPFEVSGGAIAESRALLCLTQAVYYEAGYEPLEGRRAVAQVILNRLRHPAFPKSVCGVVYQRASGVCQFTFVCDGALYRSPEIRAWSQARAVAAAALAGYVERSVGQATHYHADYVAPRWAPLLAKVHKIGAHIFYRWPGAWGQPKAFVGRYIGEPVDPASLRPAKMTIAVADDPVAGTPAPSAPVPRAPNDVGGLLDTSKGWTLNIPDPRESRSAASKVIDQQKSVDAPVVVASAAPLVSGR